MPRQKHFYACGYALGGFFEVFGVGKTPKTAYRAAWKRTPDMFCDPRDCVEIKTTEEGYESLAAEVADLRGWTSLYPEQWIGTPFRIIEEAT